MMTADQHHVLPLVDAAVVEDLGEGLADHGIARGLVQDFSEAWPERFSCLETALESQDRTDSLDAVLSLKTASLMVGASQLAWLSGQVEAHVRAADFTEATALLALIRECGTATVSEMQEMKVEGGAPATPGAPEPADNRFPAP
ncbi:MAG: Hpt domain-containing protein [Actinomycetota bacterium]